MTDEAQTTLTHGLRRCMPLRQTVAIYAGGNAIAAALQMIGGLLSTRLVDPATLGLFQGFGLALGYLPLLGLGAFEGLDRQLPYYQGKNQPHRVRSLASVAQAWALAVGSACATVFFILAIWNVYLRNWISVAGWGTNILAAFLLFFSTSYLETIYRTHNEFPRLSRVLVTRSLANIFSVPFVYLFQFYGLCARALVMLLVGYTTLWRYRPLKVVPRIYLTELTHLIRIGAPILIITQLSLLWTLLNRTLILIFMGQKELGLYVLYPMMLPALNLLPTALGQIIYPRVSEIYGRKPCIRPIVLYVIKPLCLLVLVAIPVMVIIWTLLPFGVKWFLPNYVEGVSAARWALMDLLILCLMQVRIVFFTISKQFLFLAGMGIGMIVYSISLLLLIRDGVYLEAFPQAMLIGRVVYIVICFTILAFLFRREESI